MGEVDDPFVKLLNGEIARVKRSTKMVPKGAVLTRNRRDRQRHESPWEWWEWMNSSRSAKRFIGFTG
jgi:hypothetical protein